MTHRQSLVVVPDALDVRDRAYQPAVEKCPPSSLFSWEGRTIPDRDQGDTGACTGFALANVIEYLLAQAGRPKDAPVSPWMLYAMGRRYDDIPGSNADTGSSLRGALKGWYRHGACAHALWPDYDAPKKSRDADGFRQEAARRPLGAYYRVDTRSVTDMHVALSEVGVLYASAICHAGWDAGYELTKSERNDWTIPLEKSHDSDPGHAFAIVGYDTSGFYVLNSWGQGWGEDGFARITYRDWLANAMDCWVVQLGVVTEQHREVARAKSLRTDANGKVALASNETLRNHEIAPYIVDVENEGRLSASGRFATTEADLQALFSVYFPRFCEEKNRTKGKIDVAIYAHGGLVDEGAAEKTAAKWIPALYDAGIFPVFLMWETGAGKTIADIFEDGAAALRDRLRPTAGLRDQIERWWNERLERTLAWPGSKLWGEMKENAERISGNPEGGGRKLYETAKAHLDPSRVRLHLIGHSAGSIVHSYLADRVIRDAGWPIESITFMAPAVRVDTFRGRVVDHLKSGAVGRYRQYHLSFEVENRDPTCGPYRRSLLYLVSRSFEGGKTTPILGLEESFTPFEKSLPKSVRARMGAAVAPSPASHATTHGGFDDDPETIRRVILGIKRP